MLRSAESPSSICFAFSTACVMELVILSLREIYSILLK